LFASGVKVRLLCVYVFGPISTPIDEDYLILSTIHSAKEWKSVFVLNVVDGCLPSDLGAGTSAEIEEERRLLYVELPISSFSRAGLKRGWARAISDTCVASAS